MKNKWLVLSQILDFFIKVLWSRGGGFHSAVFTWKMQGFWCLFFLLSSRSSTEQLHYPQRQVTADLLLMATCEQQKLSPGTLLDWSSGQHLLPVPTDTCICRRDWRLWLNWVPVGWEPLVYKKKRIFYSGPLDVRSISGVFLHDTERRGHCSRGSQLCS